MKSKRIWLNQRKWYLSVFGCTKHFGQMALTFAKCWRMHARVKPFIAAAIAPDIRATWMNQRSHQTMDVDWQRKCKKNKKKQIKASSKSRGGIFVRFWHRSGSPKTMLVSNEAPRYCNLQAVVFAATTLQQHWCNMSICTKSTYACMHVGMHICLYVVCMCVCASVCV